MPDAIVTRKTADGSSLTIYVSYSRRDDRLVTQLLKYLSALERDKNVEIFYDRQIEAGQEWRRTLADRLAGASIILFMLSPDALSSDFVGDEMRGALADPFKRIVPIVLQPCNWQKSPIARYVALPRDGRPVATWRKREDAFRDIAEGLSRVIDSVREERRTGHGEGHVATVRAIAIDREGRRTASASDDGAVIVWDLATLERVAALQGHTAAVNDVEFSDDSRRLITASEDATARVWDLATGRELQTIAHRAPVVTVTSTPQFVVSVARDLTAHVTSLDGTFSTRVTTLVGPDVRGATISHDGARIVTIHQDGTCRAVGITSGEGAGVWTVSTALMNQLVRLDDGVTYVAGCDDGTIQVFTLEGTHRELTVAPAAVTGLAPVPGNRYIVAAAADGGLCLCDLTTGEVVRRAAVGHDHPTAVAVTPDGTRAIWGSAAGAISSWPIDLSARQMLPEGRDRARLAYLAVLEVPALWKVLETFDEATLSAVRTQLSVPPDTDLLQFLVDRHPHVEPPPLWSAWVETAHAGRLEGSSIPAPPVPDPSAS